MAILITYASELRHFSPPQTHFPHTGCCAHQASYRGCAPPKPSDFWLGSGDSQEIAGSEQSEVGRKQSFGFLPIFFKRSLS